MGGIRTSGSLVLLVCVWTSLSPGMSAAALRRQRMSTLPSTVLWAWERTEDVRDLPADTGVAFLAQTITIDQSGPSVYTRRYAMRVDERVPLIAVTRFESPAPRRAALARDEMASIVRALTASSRLPRVKAIQVDFDATRSQRSLYLELLRAVRAGLPDDVPLSMTALASWCADDLWVDRAPVDEVVPMLFRMGPGTDFLQDAGRSPERFGAPCRDALGVSLDEPVPVVRQGRRVYLFNPQAWTRAALRDISVQEP
jgi:hypothetical protein